MKNRSEIPLDEKIRILARVLHDVVERNIITYASPLKLSVNQFLILKILFISNSQNVSDIAEVLNISRAAASKNIDFLVRKRLVSRKIVSKDRRAMCVSLRDAGEKIIQTYNEISQKKIKSILLNFNSDEQKLLSQFLDKYIIHSLDLEQNIRLICMQCGGKYEGQCYIGDHREGCYFKLQDSSDSS